jgi:hypothetical protein
MKKLLLPLCLLVIKVSAQQAIGVLENSRIRCSVSSTGDLFNTFGQTELPGFEAPANSGIRSIYAANFWIGGLSPDQQVKLAAEQYQDQGTDWFCGPLSNDGQATTNPEIQTAYNRVWTGSRADVVAHVQQFSGANPDPNYAIPQWMLEWPAHGDLALAQDFYLAPFYDTNDNNLYDPENGDYPLFCGDNCLLWIFNDKGGTHTESGGQPIGVQIIATAYTFDDIELSNAIYFNYIVKNMGTQTLSDAYVGWFSDFDIGNPSDDFAGTWVNLNAAYAYNGDTFDETSSTVGYGDDLAMSAFVLLNGPLQDPDQIDNPLANSVDDALDNQGQVYSFGRQGYGDGIPDNERLGITKSMITEISGTGTQLVTPIDYYNRLRGVWSNGVELHYGENGQNVNNFTASYMYPANTDPYSWGTEGIAVEPWDEISANNVPNDRRAFTSSGPFTFEPGEIMSLDFAYLTVIDSQEMDGLLMQLYYEIVNTHDNYQNNIISCMAQTITVETKEIDGAYVEIFPNPANEWITIKTQGTAKAQISIYDATGQFILQRSVQKADTMAIQHLAAGIYLLIIEQNGCRTLRKLMIEH